MAQDTKIQWADSTVNPTAGCDGCELWSLKKKPKDFENADQATKDRRSCYAGILHDNRGGKIAGYAKTFSEVEPFPGRMVKAARWSSLTGLRRMTKPWLDGLPRLIFVSDLSDALSKAISFDYLWMEIIQTVVSPAGQAHCWLWLTKKPKEMAKFSAELEKQGTQWPSNLWVGTSITKYEKGREHDRLSHLLKVGNEDTVRFVSVEPQFGPAAIPKRLLEKLDWIIEGGASARRRADAHPFELKWARDLQRRCKAAGVPFFLKQLGSNVLVDDERLQDSHGGNWDEWPEDLRVRQMPIYRGSKTMRGVRQRKVK